MKLLSRTSVALLVIVSSFLTQVLVVPNASASAQAEAFCGTLFARPSSTTSQNSSSRYSACIDGYDNGKGDGSVCSKYADQAQDRACRDGYTNRVNQPSPSNNGQPSNGAPAAGTPNAAAEEEAAAGEEEDKGETCAIEKIGWIACPIIEGAAKAADMAFQFLARNLLEVEPELLTANPGAAGGTVTAWEQARNLANIMFVIAFVIIIYSQITGTGLNNYGIKRMLPRLIIAALAVNVSYYICQAMVDISNLLGYNIMKSLQDIAAGIGPQVLGASPDQVVNLETSGMLGKIAIGALAIAGFIAIILPILGSVVFFVLVTCVVIALILLLRKAFIVLLVVASPLAFVMYLLPNTEKLFDKWLKMFWQLLMVFPVVALLLGGGQLASTIIMVAGATEPQECVNVNDNVTPPDPNAPADPNQKAADDPTRIQKDSYGIEGECGEPVTINGQPKQVGWTLGLVATGVAVAPLIALYSVLQAALSGAGVIGGKIGGAINNMNSGAKDTLKKRRGEEKERRQQERQIRAMNGKGYNPMNWNARSKARSRARIDRTKSRYNEAYVDYVANASVKGEPGQEKLTRFGQRLAGGRSASATDQNRTISDALNAKNKLEIENVKAAHATIDSLNDSALEAMLNRADPKAGASDPKIAAALERMAKIGNGAQLQAAANKFATGGNATLASRSLGNALAASNPGYLKSSDVDNIARGQVGGVGSGSEFQDMVSKNLADGILSPEKMASASPTHLEYAHGVAGANPLARNRMRADANRLLRDDRLKGNIGRNAGIIDTISR